MTLDPGFTTEPMQRLFSAASRVEAFCSFESALAAAQAEAGEIPAEAASAIEEACVAPLDADRILAEGWETGTPVLVLLEDLRLRLSDRDGPYLHLGATTQDVADTALMLQSRSGVSLLLQTLGVAAERLAGLAGEHRHTPTTGRTFLQPAQPMSFGVRAALWLRSVLHVQEQGKRVAEHLPIQAGGPVGDATSYGENSPAEGLAHRLGLAVPLAPWHTDRWPVRETASVLGGVAAVCSKIATDVVVLAACGEVRTRSGRSTSMSHKENPIDAIRAEAAAEVCRAAVAGLVGLPSHVLERGAGPWHAEWALMPLAFQTAGAAAEAMVRCLETLEVDAGPTAGNGDMLADGGLIDRVLAEYRSQDAER